MSSNKSTVYRWNICIKRRGNVTILELGQVTKNRRNSNRKRTQEDENTKCYFINDKGRRSTADVGGNKLARGIENESLYEIQAQDELLDFINVLKVLENYSEVQSIKVTTGELPTGGEKRKFNYLDDGIINLKYIVASIELFNGRQYKVLEIERESRSTSMLILSPQLSVQNGFCYSKHIVGLSG